MGNFLPSKEESQAEILEKIKNGHGIEVIPVEISSDQQEPKSNQSLQFSVLSYNILADCYALRQTASERKFLEFPYRSPIIIEEIKKFSSDIICLQEVDNFENYYKGKLNELNYEVIYAKRPNGSLDGSLIGFKKEKFEILQHDVIEFDKGHKYEQQMSFRRGNIAIFAKLKHKESSEIINVICAHFFWNPKFEQVKYLQMSLILQYLHKNCDKNDMVIWTGDLNTMPHTNIINYVLNRSPPDNKLLEFPNEEMIQTLGEIYQDLEKLENKIELGNAYEHYGASIKEKGLTYPLYTNYTKEFKATLDHIFYSKQNLKPRKLLKIPNHEISLASSLPNIRFPSDHLPIMVVFEALQTIKKK